MIDLHTHSTASDGTDSPAEVVKKAVRTGISTLALTDHDTIDGLDEAEETAVSCRINFVRGCEISTSVKSAHMVALWVPRNSKEVNDFLAKQRMLREKRTEKILENLKNLGMPLSMEEARETASGTIDRPHIADAMVKKGYANSREEALKEYLDSHTGMAYAPRVGAPDPFEAIRFFNKAGATVVMAHPFQLKLNKTALEKMIFDAREAGLSAIEAWYSTHDDEQTNTVIDLAQKYGLALSGGSDYHGDKKPHISLGTGQGNLDIPVSVYEALVAMRRSKGLPV